MIHHFNFIRYLKATEAATRGVLCKKMFLENSQNSQENTCARVSFLIKLQARPATLLKKRLWHRCFPVSFVNFLRTLFLQNTSGRLLLKQNQVLLVSQIKESWENFSNGLECCFVDWLNYLLLVNTSYLSVQKMFMVVTNFNIECCSKSKGFHTFYSMMKPT